MTKNGRYTYTTNTGSNSITGYRIGNDGSLSILDADGKTADTGVDADRHGVDESSRILYALAGGVPEINGFVVNGDGSLDPIETVGGLPAGTVGLAAS